MIEPQGNSAIDSRELSELEAVLASDAFRRAPMLARILEYLCRCQLRGETFVKEYEIATQVMGRSADFNPQQDGSVRVNLHHLRKKLKHYYEGEGADHDLWITLPIGHSLPVFLERRQGGGRTRGIDRAPSALPPEPTPPPLESARTDTETGARTPRHLAVPWLLVFLSLALLGALAGLRVVRQGSAAAAPPAAITDATLRIACGRRTPLLDTAGRVWMADSDYAGGKGFERRVAAVAGAGDASLYQSGREGDFSYSIPLPAGVYELHLYFAETLLHGEGFRTLAVDINCRHAEKMLDITSDAGGFASATEKIYTGVRPGADGRLRIEFRGQQVPAFVNAIEIMPGNGDRMRPIRQSTMQSYYIDPQSMVWTPDAWFSGGRTNYHRDLLPNIPWEGVYQSERFGNFTYSIPVVPNQTYAVTLFFEDAWFSRQPPPPGSPAPRRFDVACNGTALLTDFDILREAGGVRAPVVRRFSGIRSTPQGKLVLSFTPRTNYALLNALVVEQETPPPAGNEHQAAPEHRAASEHQAAPESRRRSDAAGRLP
jgi:hypothetical protein